MSEKLPQGAEREKNNYEELEKAGQERREQLRENREKSHENLAESDVEKLGNEAKEKAAEREKKPKEAEAASIEKRKTRPPAAARKASFNRTMKTVQDQQSVPSKAFSKVIHAPVVEKTSEVVGSTIARPNAILAGSLTAFVMTLGIYLFARYYGYPLSGFETIGAFVLGWIVGILFDYLRVMVTGKRI